MKVEFTQEEVNALFELMDAGVKTLGLRAAPAATVIMQKMNVAAQQEQAVATKPVEAAPMPPVEIQVRDSQK